MRRRISGSLQETPMQENKDLSHQFQMWWGMGLCGEESLARTFSIIVMGENTGDVASCGAQYGVPTLGSRKRKHAKTTRVDGQKRKNAKTIRSDGLAHTNAA